ncbi:MAG TPA: response regulator [Candidatus Dormibacteraeota bacterium]|nr:response regulator [Candidatus Dormibacteraeota bacterium]
MNHRKIMVVEDNLVEQRTIACKLHEQGYEVIVASDGAAAVSSARREKPDLILLDINFPPDVAHGGGVAWDGFLILTWLRRLDEAKDTPVIFISGGTEAQFKARALQAGAREFLRKPFDSESLCRVIETTLSTRTNAAQLEKKRVLFVDDEGDWRFVAGTVLEEAGFEVVTAKDMAEALRRMETVKLDGIVLDVNLGGENGLLLMELLKQKHPGVPILVYTGTELAPEAIEKILQDGARKCLRKGGMKELCDTLKLMVN